MRTTVPRRALGLAGLLAACGGSAPPSPAPADHGHHGAAQHGGMVHRFDDAERWAKVFDDPARDAWQKPDEVVAAMAIAPGMTAVDLGAGTGYFEGRLSAAVGASGKVIATDLEPNLVAHMRARAEREGWANVEVRQVTAADPGLAAGEADRILIVDVWHHVEGDRGAFARSLATALRPGGTITVVDFTLEAEQGPARHHRLSPEAMIAELTAGGLRAEVVAETLPDHYIVVASKP